MAIAVSPLASHLQTLQSAASSSGASSSSGSNSGPAQLEALKRIKHILIGNTNRKLELAKQKDSVALITGYLDLRDESSLRSQCCSESLAILSALAIPRTQCLGTLLDLNAHEYIIALIRDLVLSSTSESPTSTTIHPLLPSAIRALKSLYVACSDLIDPLAASSSAYELIVECALSKIHPQANGTGKKDTSFLLHNATVGSNNPRLLAAKAKGSLGERPRTDKDEIDDFAENIFLRDKEAELLVALLNDSCQRLDGSQDLQATSDSGRAQASQIVRDICEIISKCTKSSAQKDAIFNVPISSASTATSSSGAADKKVYDPTTLLFRLLGCCANQVEESVISALAILLKDETAENNRHISLVRVSEGGPWDIISARMADKSPSMRLAAAQCQVSLYKNMKRLGHAWDGQIPTVPVLAVLLALISKSSEDISAKAAFTLEYFVRDDRALQDLACNMEALKRIYSMLEQLAMPIMPYETETAGLARSRQIEGALLALASLCMDSEDTCRKVSELKLFPHIIGFLSSKHPNVVCAAAQCTRSLSRSVNVLKASFVDTNAAPALYSLLLDTRHLPLIQLTTLAVMSNVFVEYSPLKSILLSMDGLIEKIVEFTKIARPVQANEDRRQERAQQMRFLQRHHALSALRNLTYWSSPALKVRATQCLTWEYIVALLRDPDITVQTEMLNILRNIACSEEADIELVVRGIGEARLFSLIEEALWNHRTDMLVHALFLVVNIATGSSMHRQAIMNRQGIIRAIHTHLSHSLPDVRVAAVWAVVNLCHRNEASVHRRINENAQKLRSMGIESKLKEMRDDPCLDVRERVRDALESGFEPDLGGMPGMLID